MINLIGYNIEKLEKAGNKKDDEKVLMLAIKKKIQDKLESKFQTTVIKQNGKEI